jgi:hypothetical protein
MRTRQAAQGRSGRTIVTAVEPIVIEQNSETALAYLWNEFYYLNVAETESQ